VCLLALKYLVSLQARVRPSVQPELDLHTVDRSRNVTRPMTQPARLMYLSVSDDTYEAGPSPSPHFSLTRVRIFPFPTVDTPHYTCTQTFRVRRPKEVEGSLRPTE
jgi:hypothetical protein